MLNCSIFNYLYYVLCLTKWRFNEAQQANKRTNMTKKQIFETYGVNKSHKGGLSKLTPPLMPGDYTSAMLFLDKIQTDNFFKSKIIRENDLKELTETARRIIYENIDKISKD